MLPIFVYFLLLLTTLLMLLKLYSRWSIGWCHCKRDMTGKTVIITGGNSGIGKETARELARRKAKVILASRSLERGSNAAKEITATTGNENVIAMCCDLSSLQSVRDFASEILKNEDRLDVLICNAAVVPSPGKHFTDDGLEIQLGGKYSRSHVITLSIILEMCFFSTTVNHFGHFLLTNLLLDLLRKSAPSRIVVVSSTLHHFGNIRFDNLNLERYYLDPFFIYNNSKLANVLFARELEKRLKGSGVTTYSLHPGLVRTDINRSTPWYVKNCIQPLFYAFAKNAVEGAQTSVYCAIQPGIEGLSGKYFADCKESWMSRKAKNEVVAARLWEASEKLTRLHSAM